MLGGEAAEDRSGLVTFGRDLPETVHEPVVDRDLVRIVDGEFRRDVLES
ncbi:hypothetical protein REH65_28915 [Saccharopolyspora sp. ID03-671]